MNSSILSKDAGLIDYVLGETTVRYFTAPHGKVVELHCFPTNLAGQLATPREFETGPQVDGLPVKWKPQHPRQYEWLVQFKLADSPEPGSHQIGRSLRGAEEVQTLKLAGHAANNLPDGGMEIVTTLAHPSGVELQHVLHWRGGGAFFKTHTVFKNNSDHALTLEFITSFSLGGLTPFSPDEAAEKLNLHRFRSTWSAEGRHEARILEELALDRSWIGYNRRTLRFGQNGSLPVREFFPFIALEDTHAKVLWGAQLSAPGSWQLELSRLKDKVVLSGGLPSRDFGEWWETVASGDSFTTPPVTLACVHGDLDDLCAALTSAQILAAEQQPNSERELPTVFNEWCSSWGSPTHDYVVETARKLARTRTKYLVIDDGWAAKPAGQDIQFNGDWIVDVKKFPGGFKRTCAAVRDLGLIPGLWFEMECATKGTRAHELADHHLRRQGKVIEVGNRRFWDFRDPFTQDYFAERLLARLRDDGFGYLKVDYNDSLPAGVDDFHPPSKTLGAAMTLWPQAPGCTNSPGGALREHLAAVQNFFQRLRHELPELIIENCSSGGHRLEPSFQSLCAMGSFSDAHETHSIPIVAANLHRLILPRQSQIWAVLHPSDSSAYFASKLAATFLGRMCLSGDLRDLTDEQIVTINAAQDLYATAVPVIRDGRSRLHREMSLSWNQPRGWQAMMRHTEKEMLVVAHTFENAEPATLKLPLPPGVWRLTEQFGATKVAAQVSETHLSLPQVPPFNGIALLLSQ